MKFIISSGDVGRIPFVSCVDCYGWVVPLKRFVHSRASPALRSTRQIRDTAAICNPIAEDFKPTLPIRKHLNTLRLLRG